MPGTRPRFTRLAALLVTSVLTALMAAGCSSSSSPSGAPGADAGPVKPKVDRLVWALKAPPAESSNIRTICCFDSWQYRPSHEDLVGMDPKTGEYMPELATEWKLDAASNKVTFKLREGVKFHGDKWGTMTSEDVKWTYDNIVDNADTSFTWAKSFWQRVVKKIETPSANEVVMTINPDVNFFLFMSPASHQLAIRSMKQQAAEGEPKTVEAAPPVGTGAYEWVERKGGSYIRFKRVNFQHWKGMPDFPEFEFRLINEPATRMAALLANEVHVTDLPSDLSPQAERAGMKVVANQVPAPRVWGQFRCCYVDPQTGKYPMFPETPLLKKQVREALNRAINRDELGKAFAPKGRPMFINHFDPTRQAWDPTWERQFKDKYGYDPNKARQLLAEAGYTAANPLKIQVMSAPLTYIAAGPDIAESIAQYWRAVGIQPEIVNMDPATETAQQRAYKFDNMFRMQSASATLVDAINIFSVPANPPGAGYWTPEIKKMVDELNGTLDTGKQNELLKRIGDFGFNEYWDVPLWWVPLEVIVNPTFVSDYTFPGMVHGGWSHFETVKAAR